MRWPIEESFGAAKNEAGMDNYQVRLYHVWYRHITMAMLALAFLAVMRHKSKKGTRSLVDNHRQPTEQNAQKALNRHKISPRTPPAGPGA